MNMSYLKEDNENITEDLITFECEYVDSLVEEISLINEIISLNKANKNIKKQIKISKSVIKELNNLKDRVDARFRNLERGHPYYQKLKKMKGKILSKIEEVKRTGEPEGLDSIRVQFKSFIKAAEKERKISTAKINREYAGERKFKASEKKADILRDTKRKEIEVEKLKKEIHSLKVSVAALKKGIKENKEKEIYQAGREGIEKKRFKKETSKRKSQTGFRKTYVKKRILDTKIRAKNWKDSVKKKAASIKFKQI